MDLTILQSNTSSSSSAAATPAAHDSTAVQAVTKQKQDKPRHRKTRTGCFNCKRRRIKVSQKHVFKVSLLTWNSAVKNDRHVAIAQSRVISASTLH